MKQQVLFIGGGDSYGAYEDYMRALETCQIRNPLGEPTTRWTDTLRKELGDAYELRMIAMPNTDNAKYVEWKIWFERHMEYVGDEAIFVGWSLGGMFLAKYFSETTQTNTTDSLFLLGAPYVGYDDGQGNNCESFQFDPQALSSSAATFAHITILHSKDDFVVPYEHAVKYKEALPNAKLVTYEDKNHFLIDTFPELVEMIKAL